LTGDVDNGDDENRQGAHDTAQPVTAREPPETDACRNGTYEAENSIPHGRTYVRSH
jgi:hypothetical protein